MSKDYSQRIPVDREGNIVPESIPAFPAVAVNLRENGSASSVWSLNANTTAVLVTTGGTGAAIKWAGNQAASVFASALGMSWDATVPPNSARLFVVPRSVQGIYNVSGIGTPSTVGLNQSEGLYPGIATRTLGIGSVFLTEY